VQPSILERQLGSFEQFAGRGRDEDLARPGDCGDPRRGVDCQSARVARDDIDFAGMGTCPDAQAEVLDDSVHGSRTQNGSGGGVEHRHEAVTGRRDFAPVMLVKEPPQPGVVLDDQRAPGLVADPAEDR
jgi:hypothetical protein